MTITNCYKLSDLKQWEFLLSVLEPRSPKSKCWQGRPPSRGLGEVPLSPPPASGGSRVTLGLAVSL